MKIEGIDLNLLKIFYIVYRCGSFSKTAEELGITQPSVSYSIRQLENKLGVKLFERTGYSATLTSEAEVLLPYVEQALNSINMGIDNLNDFIHLNNGKITIGVPAHIGVFLLSDIIKEFNKIHPKIKIKIVSKPTRELFRLLNTNELDVIIDSSPLDDNIYNFNIQKITRESCALACNKKMKKLLNKKVTINEILEYPLIVPTKSSGCTKELIKLFEEKNIKFDPSFEITTSDVIVQLLEENLGIGYLFEKTIENYPNLEKIDLDTKLPYFDIYVINKDKTISIPAQSFIKFVKNEYKYK